MSSDFCKEKDTWYLTGPQGVNCSDALKLSQEVF